MSSIRYLIILNIAVLGFSPAWGLIGGEDKVYIQEVTGTKKTIIIGAGSLVGVKHADEAAFLTRKDPAYLESDYVAKGRCVKVFPKYSVWYLKEIKKPEVLEIGKPLHMLRLSETSGGKGSPRYRRLKIVPSFKGKGRVTEALQAHNTGIHPRLIREGKEFQSSDEIPFTEVGDDPEVDILDLAALKADTEKIKIDRAGEVNSVHITSLQEGPDSKEIEAAAKEDFFENAVSHHQKRLNKDERISLKEFRDRQVNTPGQALKKRSNLPNTSDQLFSKHRRKFLRRQDIQAWIDKKGPRWSEDMSDQELSEFIHDQGLDFEIKRKKKAELSYIYHELNISFGLNIRDNSNHIDNRQLEFIYSVNFGYEYHLSKRYPNIERWTVELGLRYNRDNIDLLDKNGKYEENSLKIATYWYPFKRPGILNTALFFLGTGIRAGTSVIRATAGNIKEHYNMRAFPSLYTGVKYRLFQGVGYRFLLTAEYVDLKLRAGGLSDTHPQAISFLDQKIELGLIYGF